MDRVIQRYTRTAIVLHWVIAVLILTNLVLGFFAEDLGEDWIRPVIDTHKSIGITVLGLVLMRVLWRATHPAPPLPASTRAWERRAAHVAHGLLYVLILVVPLTGWMHDSAWKGAPSHPMVLFGLVPFPRIGWLTALDPGRKDVWHGVLGTIHADAAFLLAGLVVLHVAGALKHQLLDGEPELQRMLP